jgi:hypothetical protein
VAGHDLQVFGQERWEGAARSTLTEAEHAATSRRLQFCGGAAGIDKLLLEHNLDALVCPSAASSFPASLSARNGAYTRPRSFPYLYVYSA